MRSTWSTSTCRGYGRPWPRSRRSRRDRRGTCCSRPAGRGCAAVRRSSRRRPARRSATRNHTEALRSYDQALALWRGDALADVALEGDAQIAVARLDQERRLVGEERVDCALALGQHLQLIPELERRVEQAPLLERPRAQLMLALYRAGRQVEALERYREGRALLVEHAGVEPGPDLRELERAILTQDPALDLAPGQGRRAASGYSHAALAARGWSRVCCSRRWSRHPYWLSHGFSSGTRARADRRELCRSDRSRQQPARGSGARRGRARADRGGLRVALGRERLRQHRLAHRSGHRNRRRRSRSTAIRRRSRSGPGSCGSRARGTRSVDRIDPQLNRRVQQRAGRKRPERHRDQPRRRVGDEPARRHRDGDRLDNRQRPRAPRMPDRARATSPTDSARSGSQTSRHRPSRASILGTGGLQPITVGNGPEAVAVGDGSVWVANSLDGTVSRIDPNSNVVTTQSRSVRARRRCSRATARSGSPTATAAGSSGSTPRRTRVVLTIIVGSGPQSLASIGGRIWLSTRDTATVHRGGTLRVFDSIRPDSLDTAAGLYGPTPGRCSRSRATVSSGSSAWAASTAARWFPTSQRRCPSPRTAAARTRSSCGAASATRTATPCARATCGARSSATSGSTRRDAGFYSALVGAATCSKARCDLSRGVVTDDRTGTVTLQLRQPDPEFFYKLGLAFAYPVPPEVSMTKGARLGVPGTGPYMVQSFRHSRIVLVRNPHFRQWSAAAQPDGYPDRIVLTYQRIALRQAAECRRARDGRPHESGCRSSRLDEIATRYAAQVHVFPATATFAIFLNTTGAAVQQSGGATSVQLRDRPAQGRCRVRRRRGSRGHVSDRASRDAGLPTLLPVHAEPDGQRRVDAARTSLGAQQLVTASGTRGQKVLVRTSDRPESEGSREVGRCNAPAARIPRLAEESSGHGGNDVLQRRSRLTYPGAGRLLRLVRRLPRRIELLRAALHLPRRFSPRARTTATTSEICNRHIDQAVNRALARQTTAAPRASNARWARGRSPGHGSCAMGAAREHAVGRVRLPALGQRSGESAVGRADRPDVGQVELSKNSATVSAPGSQTPRAASPT